MDFTQAFYYGVYGAIVVGGFALCAFAVVFVVGIAFTILGKLFGESEDEDK